MENYLVLHRISALLLIAIPHITLSADNPQNYLNALPDKKLSVEYVLQRGLQSSSTFKQIMAQVPSIENPLLQSEASLDWTLSGQATYMENFAENANTSFPTFPNKSLYDLNIQKSFLTGTSIKTGWELSEQKINFAGNPSLEYKESKLKAELNQNLLKNSFGVGTRKNIEAGALASKAAETQIKRQIEDYSLQIVAAYYQAWIDQQNTLSAEKNLKRKQLLLKSTLAKFKRGTAERPDKIQIEGSVKAAEVTWLQQKQKLQETWQNLVVSLDLPRDWLKLTPETIPLSMPSETDEKICTKEFSQLPRSSAAQEAELKAKAATFQKEAARSAALPDLSVFASLASNAIETEYGEAIDDSTKFKNIDWLVGLRFSMPLGFKAEKAQVRAALTQELASNAALSTANDQLEIDFRNYCQLMKSLETSKNILKNNLKDQATRARLEQERFDLGRSSMFNVIQASDDAAQAELQLQQVEAGLQIAHWKLKQLSGEISMKVSTLMGNLSK